jgi:hypothetical protein
VVGLNYGFAGQMKVDEITGGTPYGGTTIAGLAAQRQSSENELAGARYQVRAIAETAAKLHGSTTRSERGRALAALGAQSSGTGWQRGRDGGRPGRMEQVVLDLFADLRRARRSLRLQGTDQPPAVARLTRGQMIADAVATAWDRRALSASRARSCSSG